MKKLNSIQEPTQLIKIYEGRDEDDEINPLNTNREVN